MSEMMTPNYNLYNTSEMHQSINQTYILYILNIKYIILFL